MTDLRLKALGTVADALGVEMLFSIMNEEEQKEIFWMSAEYFINSDIYDQQKQMQILKNQARLRQFFGDNKIIKEIYDFGYNKIIKGEV